MTTIAERLRDRTTLRYMGNCKCGKCQLVPLDMVGEAANTIDGLRALSDERFAELQRAQAIVDDLRDYRESVLTCPLEIEPAGRRRIRDLCTPPKDDYDRAVLLLLDDMERLIKVIAARRNCIGWTAHDALLHPGSAAAQPPLPFLNDQQR